MKTSLVRLGAVASLSLALSACVVAPPRTYAVYHPAPVMVAAPVSYVVQPAAPVTPTQVSTVTAVAPAVVQPTVVQPAVVQPVVAAAPVYVHVPAPVVYARPRVYSSVYVRF
jgi:hypothetical protein